MNKLFSLPLSGALAAALLAVPLTVPVHAAPDGADVVIVFLPTGACRPHPGTRSHHRVRGRCSSSSWRALVRGSHSARGKGREQGGAAGEHLCVAASRR